MYSSELWSLKCREAVFFCRQVFETLISLAKNFPQQFLPSKSEDSENKEENKEKDKENDKKSNSGRTRDSSSNSFWDMLLKLDHISSSKKGKSVSRSHSTGSAGLEELSNKSVSNTFLESPIAQLISNLNHPIVKRSALLTDKLLKLLYLVSEELKNNGTEYSTSECSDELLQLAVDVLTCKACSEEGLGDATKLLQNFAHSSTTIRATVSI